MDIAHEREYKIDIRWSQPIFFFFFFFFFHCNWPRYVCMERLEGGERQREREKIFEMII